MNGGIVSVKVGIVGSGPAALNAAIYLGMGGLSKDDIAIFGGDTPGGQLTKTDFVDNYLGYYNISGQELVDKYFEHVSRYVDIKSETVISIDKQNNKFIIKTNKNTYSANFVIIASGSYPKILENIKKYDNKGVSYCHICDGFLYRKKRVAVVGGGNSAIEAVIYLSKICEEVYLIHRNTTFRAFPELVEKISKLSNVKIMLKSEIVEAKGNEFIEQIKVKNDSQLINLEVSGVFVNIGHQPQTSFVNHLVDCNSNGYILVNRNGQTTDNHLFAAGDCCEYIDKVEKFKQAIIAAAEGCHVALYILSMINK